MHLIAQVLPILFLPGAEPLTVYVDVYEVPANLRLNASRAVRNPSTLVLIDPYEPTQKSLEDMARKGAAQWLASGAYGAPPGEKILSTERSWRGNEVILEKTLRIVPTAQPDGSIKVAFNSTNTVPRSVVDATFRIREKGLVYLVAPIAGSKDRQVLFAVKVLRE